MYIYMGMPQYWSQEQGIDLEVEEEMNNLIVDAVYTHKDEYQFVEIDNSQTMRNNKNKIDKYKVLSMDLGK